MDGSNWLNRASSVIAISVEADGFNHIPVCEQLQSMGNLPFQAL
jgi:hypothetical protein